MREVQTDLWNYRDGLYFKSTQYLCITTNGDIKNDGTAVMGRGVALQAVTRWPAIAKVLADYMNRYGNHVGMLGHYNFTRYFTSFPVKDHWSEKADLVLIDRSCIELAALARIYSKEVFLLPRPGCGAGGLDWSMVRPMCDMHFELLDNIVIVNR